MIRRLLPSPSFHPSFPSSQRFAAEFPCHQDPFLKPTWCDGMESSSEIGGGHENISHSRSRSSRQSAVASVASLVFLAATLSLSGGTSSGLDLRPSFEWCWTVVFCRLQVGHGSSEKGEAVLSFLLAHHHPHHIKACSTGQSPWRPLRLDRRSRHRRRQTLPHEISSSS